jgi:excisionase family DNA binding protein
MTTETYQKKWLTVDDVCHVLGLSKRTLQNYRDQRRIPFYQVGRKIYFKMIDVDDFLERHHIKASYGQRGGVL